MVVVALFNPSFPQGVVGWTAPLSREASNVDANRISSLVRPSLHRRLGCGGDAAANKLRGRRASAQFSRGGPR